LIFFGANLKPVRPETVKDLLKLTKRPKKAVVTAGMPYANGPLHIGHLAGAHVPADIYARYMKMLIGANNVLFVCGTDDHGSTSEVSALKEGKPIQDFISGIHDKQKETMRKFSIELDVYTGTSRPETFPIHSQFCQEKLRELFKNEMLEKKTSEQWYDCQYERFLPDRYVVGTCPKCDNPKAYSDECDSCGANYEPKELKEPISTLSKTTPELRATDHWWLDMWKVSDVIREWIESKKKDWRKGVYQEVISTVMPCLKFSNQFEDLYKEIKSDLPKHKSRYAPGKQIVAQFNSLDDLKTGEEQFKNKEIAFERLNDWAYRSITRDVSWGIPLPEEIDSSMKGKSLYVWPDSLWAPIAFTQVALKNKGLNPDDYKDYWCDPEAKVAQFLGQDNVFFYVIMQAALWLGTSKNPKERPGKGELQLSDIYGSYHLQLDNQKMSKSTGNFYTGDQLIDEKGLSGDQVRYFLAILSLAEKTSNFDFDNLHDRNKFLAGPLNAAFEKPISACHSKFDGVIPEGNLLPKAEQETFKIVRQYLRSMERAEYPKLLFAIENYTRLVNSFFTQYKPHDDRHDEQERKDALYSCFYILKNILIMLAPFAPETMDKLRVSLNLPEDVLSVDQLGEGIEFGHKIGEKMQYFPVVE
jgi:methionyl-tRNA synthetase